jgi:Tat protein secretion system quality control protein TatD with DNase activity
LPRRSAHRAPKRRSAARCVRSAHERLLIETDCPYLAPVPKRGRRCRVTDTAEIVAREAGLSYEELAAQTTANACRIYRISAA